MKDITKLTFMVICTYLMYSGILIGCCVTNLISNKKQTVMAYGISVLCHLIFSSHALLILWSDWCVCSVICLQTNHFPLVDYGKLVCGSLNLCFRWYHINLKAINYTLKQIPIWAQPCENLSSDICGHRRPRSTCASAQSDQDLRCPQNHWIL